MSWTVVAFGDIEVDDKYMKEIVELMIGDKKKVIDRLIGNVGEEFDDVEGTDGYITFKMWGNKSVDYRRLEEIKKYCQNKKISVRISTSEYSESGNGFYYDSKEETNECRTV